MQALWGSCGTAAPGHGEAATEQGLWLVSGELGQAVNVLDRFHIMAHFSKTLDEVHAGEVKELKAKGYEPVLTKSRWLLL